jgi:hypothetical protein
VDDQLGLLIAGNRQTPNHLRRLVTEDADPRILAVFRIAYALVGLVLASQMLRESDFLWLRNDPRHFTGTGILAGAIGVLIALCAGFGGRALRILHFAIFSYLVAILPITCIDYSLYLIAAFWGCLLDLNVAWSLDKVLASRLLRYPRMFVPPLRARAWPVFLLGCNLGLLIFSAGVMKHLDPQWRSGDGFYFTFLLPWIKPVWLAPLLGHHRLFQIVNFSVMAIEYSILPLFLWRPTRPLSVLLTAVFFSGLIFPLRIDPIGYVGISHCLCLAALAKNALASNQSAAAHNDVAGNPRAAALIVVAALTFLAGVFGSLHYHEFRNRLTNVGGDRLYVRYPLKIVPVLRGSNPLTIEQPPSPASMTPIIDRRGILRRAIDAVDGLATRVNSFSTRLQVNHVFGIADSRGNYLYRVVLTLEDGSVREPFRAFLEDMRAGPYTSGILVPRFIQGSMYDLSFAVDEITFGRRAPNVLYRSLMERLIQFSESRLLESERKRVVAAAVLVRPILMPDQFAGNVEPWKASDWTDLYRWDAVSDRGGFRSNLTPYPLTYPLRDGWRLTIAP